MSAATRRVFTGLTRTTFSRGVFVQRATATVGTCVRPLTLSSRTSAESKDGDKDVNSGPMKFSTSKASHRTWKVDRSMGSQFERPWWKVLPVSLIFTSFLLWCVLRSETDIDVQLEKQLYEHMLPDEEEQTQNK